VKAKELEPDRLRELRRLALHHYHATGNNRLTRLLKNICDNVEGDKFTIDVLFESELFASPFPLWQVATPTDPVSMREIVEEDDYRIRLGMTRCVASAYDICDQGRDVALLVGRSEEEKERWSTSEEMRFGKVVYLDNADEVDFEGFAEFLKREFEDATPEDQENQDEVEIQDVPVPEIVSILSERIKTILDDKEMQDQARANVFRNSLEQFCEEIKNDLERLGKRTDVIELLVGIEEEKLSSFEKLKKKLAKSAKAVSKLVEELIGAAVSDAMDDQQVIKDLTFDGLNTKVQDLTDAVIEMRRLGLMWMTRGLKFVGASVTLYLAMAVVRFFWEWITNPFELFAIGALFIVGLAGFVMFIYGISKYLESIGREDLFEDSEDYIHAGRKVLRRDVLSTLVEEPSKRAACERVTDRCMAIMTSSNEVLVTPNSGTGGEKTTALEIERTDIDSEIDRIVQQSIDALESKDYKSTSANSQWKKGIDLLKSMPMQLATLAFLIAYPVWTGMVWPAWCDTVKWTDKALPRVQINDANDSWITGTRSWIETTAKSPARCEGVPNTIEGLKSIAIPDFSAEAGQSSDEGWSKNRITAVLKSLTLPMAAVVWASVILWRRETRRSETQKAIKDLIKRRVDILKKSAKFSVKSLKKSMKEYARNEYTSSLNIRADILAEEVFGKPRWSKADLSKMKRTLKSTRKRFEKKINEAKSTLDEIRENKNASVEIDETDLAEEVRAS